MVYTDRPLVVPRRGQPESGAAALVAFMCLWFAFGACLFAAEALQSTPLYWVTCGIGAALIGMALANTR